MMKSTIARLQIELTIMVLSGLAAAGALAAITDIQFPTTFTFLVSRHRFLCLLEKFEVSSIKFENNEEII